MSEDLEKELGKIVCPIHNIEMMEKSFAVSIIYYCSECKEERSYWTVREVEMYKALKHLIKVVRGISSHIGSTDYHLSDSIKSKIERLDFEIEDYVKGFEK